MPEGAVFATSSVSVLDSLRSITVARYLSDDPHSLGLVMSNAPAEILTAQGDLDLSKFSIFLLATVSGEDKRLTEVETRLGGIESFLTSIGFSTTTLAIDSSTPAYAFSSTTIANFFESLGARLSAGVAEFKNLIVESLTAKDKLCLNATCVTEDQLKTLLQNNNLSPSSSDFSGSPMSTSTTSADLIPPVITLNGANPATIILGSSYIDLGATVTDNVDHNLGIQVTGDTAVDTSTIGSYTVTYTATDQAGNTATATRTVNVEELPLPTLSEQSSVGQTTNNQPLTTESTVTTEATTEQASSTEGIY